MLIKKFKVITELVATISLVFLAVYGLMQLVNDSVATWRQGTEITKLESSALNVPLVINYQADMKDAEGNPLNGSYNMTFRIYSGVVAPTVLWEERHQNVTVRGGHFNVLLGKTTALPKTLFDEPDRVIRVTVDPYDEMGPRQRLGSVPYAMHSYHATLSFPKAHLDFSDQMSFRE